MRRRRVGAAIGVAALLLVATAACGSDDDDETDASDQSDSNQAGREIGDAIGSQTTPSAPTTTTPVAVPVRDLGITSVAVPSAAPSGNDACQPPNPTSFAGENLNDGLVDTAWRTAGDATGQELTVTLDGQHDVRSVGLVPGYAKVDPCDGTDRFFQNRRVVKVTWFFDDGTSVSQDLADTTDTQSVNVTATSTTIRLRIEAVTADGGKDFTALSEITVRGA